MTTGLIELVEHDAQPVAVVRGHVGNSEFDAFLTGAFEELTECLAAQRVHASGPPFARYRATGRGLDVEAGFPVDGGLRPAGRVLAAELPGGLRVVAPHVGHHGTVGFTYELLTEWLAGNGYTATGDAWESYRDGYGESARTTVVTVPCRERPRVPPPRIHV
jgi:effector-binding domain-containing protein